MLVGDYSLLVSLGNKVGDVFKLFLRVITLGITIQDFQRLSLEAGTKSGVVTKSEADHLVVFAGEY